MLFTPNWAHVKSDDVEKWEQPFNFSTGAPLFVEEKVVVRSSLAVPRFLLLQNGTEQKIIERIRQRVEFVRHVGETAGAGNGGHVEVVVAEVDEDGVVVEDNSPEKCIFILLSLARCGGHREQDKLGADQQEVGKVQAEVPYSGASPLNAQQIYVVEVLLKVPCIAVAKSPLQSGKHFNLLFA